jgi:hypothetical protein
MTKEQREELALTIDEIRRLFEAADTDNNGTLSKRKSRVRSTPPPFRASDASSVPLPYYTPVELRDLITTARRGNPVSDAELEGIWGQLDRNNDMVVQWEELADTLVKWFQGNRNSSSM